MQERNLALRCFQQHEPVVIDWHIPVIGMCETLHLSKLSQEPARKIDQVRPLVDQLPATGKLGLCRHSLS